MHRQEYIRRLKRDLDRWNGQIAAWEETLFELRSVARRKLAERIESWRSQRNAVAQRLRELQSASDAASRNVVCGADRAGRLAKVFERTRCDLGPSSNGQPRG